MLVACTPASSDDAPEQRAEREVDDAPATVWDEHRHADIVLDGLPEDGVFDEVALGACYLVRPDDVIVDPSEPVDVFRHVASWLRATGEVDLDVVNEVSYRAGSDQFTTVSGDGPPRREIDLDRVPAERMQHALGAGADVYIGLAEHGEQTSNLVAVLDDRVAFLSDCGYRVGALVDAFALEHGTSGSEVFLALIEGEMALDELVDWYRSEPSDPRDAAVWEQLDPQERSLEPGFVPEEIEAVLVGLPVLFDFRGPDADGVICLDSDEGRSGCFAPTIGIGSTSPSIVPGHSLRVVGARLDEVGRASVDVQLVEIPPELVEPLAGADGEVLVLRIDQQDGEFVAARTSVTTREEADQRILREQD